MWPPQRPFPEGPLPHRYCQAVITNRKDLKLSFTEGQNPFRLLWGKEQRLGYLQQRCTQWSLWAPRLVNFHWDDGKVVIFRMAFVCHALACQHLHAIRLRRVQVVALSIGPLCCHDITRSNRQIGNVSVTYVTLVPWWREWRCYVPMPQSWTIAGLHSFSLLSVKPNEWMHLLPFITVCTGSGAGRQNPLANIHCHFLLKSEMIGASK